MNMSSATQGIGSLEEDLSTLKVTSGPWSRGSTQTPIYVEDLDRHSGSVAVSERKNALRDTRKASMLRSQY